MQLAGILGLVTQQSLLRRRGIAQRENQSFGSALSLPCPCASMPALRCQATACKVTAATEAALTRHENKCSLLQEQRAKTYQESLKHDARKKRRKVIEELEGREKIRAKDRSATAHTRADSHPTSSVDNRGSVGLTMVSNVEVTVQKCPYSPVVLEGPGE